VLFLSDTNIFS